MKYMRLFLICLLFFSFQLRYAFRIPNIIKTRKIVIPPRIWFEEEEDRETREQVFPPESVTGRISEEDYDEHMRRLGSRSGERISGVSISVFASFAFEFTSACS
eukprot:TRINITY_DN4004_c0_g4_i3.p1 TRINITY_DN4004_c0_g4~~TRINITY_DN4004_c0_g4_i3.p1  ORF type:complete len:104 (-),score=16.50 TRINITY_DN4004_c0_g4_i3:178-489(-)